MHDWKLTTFQNAHPGEVTPISSRSFFHFCIHPSLSTDVTKQTRLVKTAELYSTQCREKESREKERDSLVPCSERSANLWACAHTPHFHYDLYFNKSLQTKNKHKKKMRVSPLVRLLPRCQTKCRHVATARSSGSFKQSVCFCREVYALPACVNTLFLAALTLCVVCVGIFQCDIIQVPKAPKCTCFCLYWCTFFLPLLAVTQC